MTSPHRTSAFKGAVLSVGMRWTDRLIGLVSTLILARLLAPADFGVVAMAMVVVGLIDVFMDLGVSAALIQNRTADRDDFNTAWSLRLCQAAITAAVIAAGAPLVADYYGDARVVDVLRVIALSVLVAGAENIGIVHFQKDMEFGRDFQFFFYKRVLGTAVTLALALTLRSYWALVLGSLAGRVVGVLLSYAMHTFRPRFSFARVRQIWAFSQWNIVLSSATYLAQRLDQLVVGRRSNAAVLGAYSVGDEIATLPTTEILAPLGRVMFPAFVNARSQPAELERIVLLAFAVQVLIGMPAGCGVALVAPEMVPIVLGDQWAAAIPFVQVLALVGVATAVAHSGHYALLALGRVRTLAVYSVFRFAALLALLTLILPEVDAVGVAEARLGVAVVALILMQALVKLAMPNLRLGAFLANSWRPAMASIIMVGVVLGAVRYVQPEGPAVALLLKVGAGVGAYLVTLVVLWWVAGRPEGAEIYLLEKIGVRRTPV